MRRRRPPIKPTQVVTGLVISRRTVPKGGPGSGSSTIWTAHHRGMLLGTWNADSMASCWVQRGGFDVQRGALLYLRDWRAAVVEEAARREYDR